MAVDSADRNEISIKIEGSGGPVNPSGSAVAAGGNKIWRESSYDFLNNPEKMMKRKEEEGGSSSSSNAAEEFDFNQSKQPMDDPPSKLIGQFLHKQKASGEISLDMDLEMDELQHGNRVLPPVSESPLAAGSRVSFEQPVQSQRESVRRRQNSESPGMEDGGDDGEVVRCSSNGSFQRNRPSFQRQTSNLLKAKTKSRLMDPPTPERGEPKSAKAA